MQTVQKACPTCGKLSRYQHEPRTCDFCGDAFCGRSNALTCSRECKLFKCADARGELPRTGRLIRENRALRRAEAVSDDLRLRLEAELQIASARTGSGLGPHDAAFVAKHLLRLFTFGDSR